MELVSLLAAESEAAKSATKTAQDNNDNDDPYQFVAAEESTASFICHIHTLLLCIPCNIVCRNMVSVI